MSSTVNTDSIDIPIGGTPRRFHIWASEITLQELVENEKISKKYLYDLVRDTNKSNVYLDALLKVALKDEKNSLMYNKIIKEIEKGNKKYDDLIDEVENNTKTTEEENRKSDQKFKTWFDINITNNKNLIFVVRRSFDIMISHLSSMSKNLMEGNLSAAVESLLGGFSEIFKQFSGVIPGILSTVIDIIASGTGMIIRSYEETARALANMVNVGAGLGVGLIQLRNQATLLGVSLESFSDVISKNSKAMLGLANNVNTGAQNFVNLASEVRDRISEFNQFGLSNSELLDAIAEEIDLRRRSGQSAIQIQSQLADGMNELLLQTTMMANLTGQDRRELLRTRQQRSRDPIVGAFATTLRNINDNAFQNFNMISTVASEQFGQSGTIIADAIQRGLATGRGIEGSPELMQMIGLMESVSPQAADSLREFAQNLFNQYEATSPEEFTRIISTGLGNIAEEFSSGNLRTLFNIAASDSAYRTLAENLLTFGTSVQGIGRNQIETVESMENLEEALRNEELLRLPAAIEQLSNTLKASLLLTVMQVFDNIPEFNNIFGSDNIVDNIDTLTNLFIATDDEGRQQIKTIVDAMGELTQPLFGNFRIDEQLEELRNIGTILVSIQLITSAIRAIMLARNIFGGFGDFSRRGGPRGPRGPSIGERFGNLRTTIGNGLNTLRQSTPSILTNLGTALRSTGPQVAVTGVTMLGTSAINRSHDYAEEIVSLADQNGITLTPSEINYLRSGASLQQLSYLRENIRLLPDYIREQRRQGRIREPIIDINRENSSSLMYRMRNMELLTDEFQPADQLSSATSELTEYLSRFAMETPTLPVIQSNQNFGLLTYGVQSIGQLSSATSELTEYLNRVASEPSPNSSSQLNSTIREITDDQIQYMMQLIEEERISRRTIMETLNDNFRRLTDAVQNQ